MQIDIRKKVINTFGKTRLVQSENGAEKVLFRFMDPIENPEDLGWSLAWANEDGTADITPLTAGMDDEGHTTAEWTPTRTELGASGKLTIQIRGLGPDADGGVRKYMTLPSYFMVGDDIVEGIIPVEPEMLDLYLAKFEKIYNDTKREASEVIDEEATAKIAEIIAARDNALSGIGEAKSSSLSEIGSAREGAITAIDTARESAAGAVNTAKASALNALNGRRDELKESLTSHADTLKSTVQTAGTTAINNLDIRHASLATALDQKASIIAEGLDELETQKVSALNAHADEKKRDISATAATRTSEMQAKADSLISDIRAEGDTQAAKVTTEANAQVARIGVVADAAVKSIDDEELVVTDKVKAEGSAQVAAVTAEGDTQIERISTEIDPKINELQSKVSSQSERIMTLETENLIQGYRIENLEALVNGEISEEKTLTTTNGVAQLETDFVAPNAIVESVMGKTVVWNQLIGSPSFSYRDFRSGYAGVSISMNADKSYTLSGTQNSTTELKLWLISFVGKANHTYCLCGDNNEIKCYIGSNTLSVSGGSGAVYTPSTDSTVYIGAVLEVGKTYNGTVALKLVDLTQLGTEDLNFVRSYAEAHPQYDTGSLVNSMTEEVKSVGRNLWKDASAGWIRTDGTLTSTSDSTNVVVKIPCKVGETFTISGFSGTIAVTAFYDASYAYITGSRKVATSGNVLTSISAPSNASYVVFGVENPSGKNIMLNTGSTALEYTPYMTSTLTIPSLELKEGDVYEPSTGMLSESWSEHIDMGEFTWSPASYGAYAWDIEGTSSPSRRFVTSANNVEFRADGALILNDTRYASMSREAIKAEMVGKKITYELAEPIAPHKVTEPIDPTIRIEGGGTISVVSEGATGEATIHYLKKYVGGTV